MVAMDLIMVLRRAALCGGMRERGADRKINANGEREKCKLWIQK